MNETVQLRFCGFGGQGILLMGTVLGDAAVRQGLWVAGSNSYGSQARGSACRSEVVLSRGPVDFPHVLEADVLVAMSQEAYHHFLPSVCPEGVVIHDDPQVKRAPESQRVHVPIPATRSAVEDLGTRQVANMVILAAAVSLTGVVSRETLVEAVEEGVASRFKELNLRALEKGFALGEAARDGIIGGGIPMFAVKR